MITEEKLKPVNKGLLKAFGDKCHNLFKYNPYHLTNSIKGNWIKVNTVIPYNGFDKLYLGVQGISTTGSNENKKAINSIFYLDSLTYSHGFNLGNDLIEAAVFLKVENYLQICLKLSNERYIKESTIDVLAYLNNDTEDLVKTPVVGGEYINELEEPSTYVQVAIDGHYPFNSNKIGLISSQLLEETRFTLVENVNGLSEISSTYPETTKFYKIYESEMTNKLSHGLKFQYDWENPIGSEDDPVDVTNGILEEFDSEDAEHTTVKIPVPNIFTSGVTSEGFASKVKVENGIVTDIDYSSDIPNATTSVIGGIKLFKDSNTDNTNILQESQFPVLLDSGNRAYVQVPVSDIHRFYDLSEVPEELKKSGYIVQYIGKTTEDYTRGYFYQYTPTNFDVVSPIANTKWIFSDSAEATGQAIADYNINLDYLITSGDLVLQMQLLVGQVSIDDNTLFTVLQNNAELTELSYAKVKEYFKVERNPNYLTDLTDTTCTLTLSIPSDSETWKQKNVQPLLKVGSPLVYKGLATWLQLQDLAEKEIGDFYTVTDKDNQEYFWNGESWEFMGKVVNVPTYSLGNGIDITASGNDNVISVKYDNSTIKKNNSGDLYVDGKLTDTTYTAGNNISIDSHNSNAISADGYVYDDDKHSIKVCGEQKTVALYGFSVNDTTETNNDYETAFGRYNLSTIDDVEDLKEKNTHFSIGIGEESDDPLQPPKLINAFEIKLNGDLYIKGLGDYDGIDFINAKPIQQLFATVATTGSYNDLSNKPTIPAAQVNADWNSNSGLSKILNKPSLATVATSGSYTDLSNTPTIPTVPTNVSDFTNDAGYTTNTGTITSITAGSGLTTSDGNVIITSGTILLDTVVSEIEVPQQTHAISINYSRGKYNKVSVENGDTLTIGVMMGTPQSGTVYAKEIILRIDNTSTSESTPAKIIVSKEGNGEMKNMYNANIETSNGLSLYDGETMELVFTFWNNDDVTFNGGISV